MNRFIKTFVDKSLLDIVNKANDLAVADKLNIVNAQLSFIGAGTISEQMVLTVVYEREQKQRKQRSKSGEGGGGNA